MYDFFLQIIAVLSGAMVVYVLGRALPRVSENEYDAQPSFLVRLDGFVKRLPLKKIDEEIMIFLERLLRKVRVLNLRLENFVNVGILKLRHGKDDIKKEEARTDLFEK